MSTPTPLVYKLDVTDPDELAVLEKGLYIYIVTNYDKILGQGEIESYVHKSYKIYLKTKTNMKKMFDPIKFNKNTVILIPETQKNINILNKHIFTDVMTTLAEKTMKKSKK